MHTTPKRLALIGTGRWGSNIIKTLAEIPDCVVAYQATRDWQALVEKTDIDGVIIATPAHTHAQIAIPFIERGLPVFIEKPMTSTLEDAHKVAATAKKSDSTVFVGHIHLYNPAFLETKKYLKNIGTIRLLVGEGANSGPRRDDISALWDWAPHDISMMLDTMGEMPTDVEAWGISITRPNTKLYDVSEVKLNFKNGAVGLIFSSWLMPQKRKRFSIVGETGSVVYDDTLPEKKVAVFDTTGASPTYPVYDSSMPLTLELEAFVRTVTKKEKPQTDLEQGLAVVTILDAAERSIAAGSTVIHI